MSKAAEQKVDETPAADATISETDLLKAAQTLEAEATGAAPVEEPAADPKVAAVAAPELAKTLEEKGTEILVKSLDVSATLKEVVDILGDHVDGLSKSFAGTLDNQNAAILSICGALEGMQKAITDLGTMVEKYGEKPAAPASAAKPATKPADVLAKGAGAGSGDEKETPEVTRAQVNDALLSLTKTATKDGDEEQADRYEKAAVKFDACGEIADRDLNAAMGEHKRITG